MSALEWWTCGRCGTVLEREPKPDGSYRYRPPGRLEVSRCPGCDGAVHVLHGDLPARRLATVDGRTRELVRPPAW